MTNLKSFVLDTNVLLHAPEAIRGFGQNEVVIPIDVLEELDKFKTQNDELGRNAREVIRILDKARESGGRLGTGVKINERGGTLRVDLKPLVLIEAGLERDSPDNRILSIAYKLHKEGKTVTFVSKDVNVRIKADALGIKAEDYETDKITTVEEMYSGWREVEVGEDDLRKFFEEHRLEIPAELHPNEGVLLRDRSRSKRTAIGRRAPGGPDTPAKGTSVVRPLLFAQEQLLGIAPRNLEQRIALDLLLDPAVSLVTLVGRAGTGKTLLALVAGLHLTVKQHQFEKLLVSRPIMPLGRDLGFLPGTKEEKLEPWMKPIFDNMKFVLREKREPGEVSKKISELMKSGIVEMEALTYIRGRSIHAQFMIVDECQNLTPHEVKTIISRAGHETKIVLTGDPYQIDNPYLDSSSNGLTYVAEKLKNQDMTGHMVFTKSERSPLASVAAEVL
ncbi:MAG TPA: PhoH family protein [Planctomycetota bacterium]|nr:PhoH family protein [Planctomycetota bacterium]